jgi:serine/threonine protein kinase
MANTALNIPAQKDEHVKECPDRAAFRRERGILLDLAGLSGVPTLLSHDERTRILRISDAGKDLIQFTQHERHVFSVSQVRQVLRGILEGLQTMHAKGIYHYDVTPRNVCIQGDLSGSFKVTLVDFGLSFSRNKIPEAYRTQRVGTPSCLSPEHIAMKPELGEAADVFCAGLTILQLFDGGAVVLSRSLGKIEPQVMEAHRNVPERMRNGEPIPSDLQVLLKIMLNPDPEYRRSRLCLALLGE